MSADRCARCGLEFRPIERQPPEVRKALAAYFAAEPKPCGRDCSIILAPGERCPVCAETGGEG